MALKHLDPEVTHMIVPDVLLDESSIIDYWQTLIYVFSEKVINGIKETISRAILSTYNEVNEMV